MDAEKQYVPWFAKYEWNDVFEKIYSNDPLLQNEAYEKMCIWKVRCPKLPVGVECTMEILQVHLLNQKINDSSSDKDFILIASTVIMRFVNSLSHLYTDQLKQKMTCYGVARILNIPDWIVNIRHNAAHSNVLTSREVIIDAANFALQWLYEHYWLVEAKEAHDFIVEEIQLASNENKMQMLLNIWQACKLYTYCKRIFIYEVSNSFFKSHLFLLYNHYYNCFKDSIDLDFPDNIFSSASLETYLKNDGTLCKVNIEIKKSLKCLLNYMKYLLTIEPDKGSFVKVLINSELFLPTTNDVTYYTNGTILNQNISSLWKDVIELFHESQLVSELMSQLATITIKDSIRSRQLVAACWLSHLSTSLLQPSTSISADNLVFADSYLHKKQSKRRFKCKDHLINLNLSKEFSLNNHISENIVNKVISSPNVYTRLFLPSLLSLLNPPLNMDAKSAILQLVSVYTNSEDVKMLPTSDKIYTPDMLPCFESMSSSEILQLKETITNEEIEDMELGLEDYISNSGSVWSKCKGVYDWKKYPLGQLPDRTKDGIVF